MAPLLLGIVMNRYDEEYERAALREHAEHHYGEDRMTKLDWFKAIAGALIAVPIMYAMMVIIMVL